MSASGAPAGGRSPADLPSAAEDGFTLLEVLLALSLVLVLAGLCIPLTAASIDANRARQAAGFLASRLRLAKQQAVVRAASVGLVFDQVEGRWIFSMCVDGNGNGLRRTDLARGTDRCVDGSYDMASMFPGVRIAVDDTLPGPDGEAPSSDAVRLGRSDLASFSPGGTCTAGSVFLRSGGGAQYAVRVAGVTGRTRILAFDYAARVWTER